MAKNCPGCGAPMEYDPGFDSLVCSSCGNIIDPKTLPDADDFYYGNEEAGGEPVPVEDTLSEFDELTGEMYDCHIYTCSQCGGEVVVTGTEISTRCAFCGSTSVVFNRISKEHRPDLIVPFKVTKEEALDRVQKTLDAGLFVQKKFRTLSPECVRGIYIPYFTYDGVVTDNQRHQRYSSENVTVYDIDAEFRNLLVESCQALDDRSTEMLDPYDMSEAVDFDTSYLMGFYSNIQDLPARASKGLAELKARKFINTRMYKMPPVTMKKNLGSSMQFDLHRTAYVLLPVWFVTINDNGTPYTYLVNGQTGKVVGSAPWNKVALIGAIVGSCVLSTALLTFIYLKFGVPFFRELFPDDVHIFTGATLMRIIGGLTIFGSFSLFVIALRKIRSVWQKMTLSRSLMTFIFSKKRQGGIR